MVTGKGKRRGGWGGGEGGERCCAGEEGESHRWQSEGLGGWSLTRSRRFVNIQFRSGLIANRLISFLVLTRSSFGYPRSTLLNIIRVQHQLRPDLRIKLLPRQMSQRHRRLLQRRPLPVGLFRALGDIYTVPQQCVMSATINEPYCRSQGDCSVSWPA